MFEQYTFYIFSSYAVTLGTLIVYGIYLKTQMLQVKNNKIKEQPSQ